VRDQLELLTSAGFSQPTWVDTTGTKTSGYTSGTLFMAINGSGD
jgi:hypothetical protein